MVTNLFQKLEYLYKMKSLSVFFILPALLASNNIQAVTISQCVQADGTVEFTNQGCSGSSKRGARHFFSKNFTRSIINKTSTRKHRQKPFRQKEFVQLQTQLLKAQSLAEMEKHTRDIMYKVNGHAQKGNLRAAYNMIAATYAKLAKEHKKQQWEGVTVSENALKVQSLFENILITQSTTSKPAELTQIIQIAWDNFQNNI